MSVSRLEAAPASWFLTHPPTADPRAILRTRVRRALIDALDASGVVLLSAPPGYGKTTAAADLSALHPATTAWLSLTPHDACDENRLIAGIVAALHDLASRAQPHLAEILGTARHVPGDNDSTFASLAALAARLPCAVTLILDNAHLSGASLAQRVAELLTRAPVSPVRLVLVGEPPLQQHFAFVEGEPVRVLGTELLALDADEVRGIARAQGVSLSAAQAEALRRHAHGWAIGVKLSVAEMTPRERPGSFAFPSDPYPVADGIALFLERRLLPDLSEEEATTLLDLTTCSGITERCAAVLCGPRGPELLRRYARNGLFLEREVRRDGEAGYRWHEGFAAACRIIRRQKAPERAEALERAAALHVANHDPAHAFSHARRSGDTELCAELVVRFWLRWIAEGSATWLERACKELDPSGASDSRLLLVRAACRNLLGDHLGARYLWAQAGELPEREAARGTEHVEPFATLILEDDHSLLAAAADRAWDVLQTRPDDEDSRADRLFLLGWTELRLRRRPARANELLRAAVASARLNARSDLAARAEANLAFSLAFAGEHAASAELRTGADGTVSATDWYRFDGGIGAFAQGFSEFWRGNFAAAAEAFAPLLGDEDRETYYAGLARVFTAFIEAASGVPVRIRTAMELLRRVPETEAHGVPWGSYRGIATALLLAASGHLEAAVKQIDALPGDLHVPVLKALSADLLRRAGYGARALTLIAGFNKHELAVSHVAASAMTTAALVAFEQGEKTRAHSYLERALSAAAPQGVSYPFMSGEQALADLLRDHAHFGTAHETFLAGRISALSSKASPLHSPGSEPLSTREREVLAHLRTTMTAGEIAAAMCISVNTVRTHQRAIYRKLGVANRREAIRLRG